MVVNKIGRLYFINYDFFLTKQRFSNLLCSVLINSYFIWRPSTMNLYQVLPLLILDGTVHIQKIQ